MHYVFICFRKLWEKFVFACYESGSLYGITWAGLRAQLDGVELKKTFELNPLAPEFVPRFLQTEESSRATHLLRETTDCFREAPKTTEVSSATPSLTEVQGLQQYSSGVGASNGGFLPNVTSVQPSSGDLYLGSVNNTSSTAASLQPSIVSGTPFFSFVTQMPQTTPAASMQQQTQRPLPTMGLPVRFIKAAAFAGNSEQQQQQQQQQQQIPTLFNTPPPRQSFNVMSNWPATALSSAVVQQQQPPAAVAVAEDLYRSSAAVPTQSCVNVGPPAALQVLPTATPVFVAAAKPFAAALNPQPQQAVNTQQQPQQVLGAPQQQTLNLQAAAQPLSNLSQQAALNLQPQQQQSLNSQSQQILNSQQILQPPQQSLNPTQAPQQIINQQPHITLSQQLFNPQSQQILNPQQQQQPTLNALAQQQQQSLNLQAQQQLTVNQQQQPPQQQIFNPPPPQQFLQQNQILRQQINLLQQQQTQAVDIRQQQQQSLLQSQKQEFDTNAMSSLAGKNSNTELQFLSNVHFPECSGGEVSTSNNSAVQGFVNNAWSRSSSVAQQQEQLRQQQFALSKYR